jgi:hypothetical protein
MQDVTDHNRFAGELHDRLVEHRVAELNTFERRAAGLVNPFSFSVPTAAIAAKVATQPGAITMNMHQSQTSIIRPTSLFQPAEVTSAFMKMGLLGFQGSGKTKTAAKVVIGLVRHMREQGISYANKPVMFLDTETGSDWVIPDFKAAGIRLNSAKTRSFADLLSAVDEAEQNGSALIIDSITHFWMELTQSYMKMKKRTRLQFEDWGYLKSEWAKFTDRYVNSSAHIALCGRAGFEYDYTVDDETQKKNLEKTGVKMKAEGEMGYEPSLLVLMERQQEIEGNKIKRVWRTATILKDRAARLDGQSFEDPGFEEFLPHIQMLNLGGRQMGVDTSRNSQHMITPDKRDWQPVQREICIDEIQTLLALHYPSQSADDKKAKLKALLAHFDATWTEIEKVMPLSDLRAGYDSLHITLEGRPSKYGAAIAKDNASTDLNDSLPEGMAPLAVATAVVTETLTTAAAIVEAFDESKWLAELTKAFGECVDFVTFGQKQQTLMAPAKEKVSAPTWKKAVKLATACVTSLAENPGGVRLAAAE